MFQVKAPSPLHLAPPPGPPQGVRIGCAFSPGTLVRMPVKGMYYETLPADLGPDADLLQAALLKPARRPRSTRLLWLALCNVVRSRRGWGVR